MKNKWSFSNILIALAAVSFFIAGAPILDSIGSWISNYFGLKTIKLNAEAEKITEESSYNKESVHTIGFQIPSEECEEIEYE